MNTSLTLSASAQRISMEKSTMLHPDAGLGLFASRELIEGEVIGYYYGSVVNSNLTKERQTKKAYWKRIMQVTLKMC